VRALWNLADQHAKLGCHRCAPVATPTHAAWKAIASGLFTSVEDPGVCAGATHPGVRLAETETVLKGEEADQAIRTIVCARSDLVRERPLASAVTTSAGFPADLFGTVFRGRTGP